MFCELFSLFVCFNKCNSVNDLIIYLLCYLNCFVLPVKITLPRNPTDWGSTVQELGEHLKCGPPDFPARYAPPVSGELPGGSPVCTNLNLNIQIFMTVKLCCWVTSSVHFEGP